MQFHLSHQNFYDLPPPQSQHICFSTLPSPQTGDKKFMTPPHTDTPTPHHTTPHPPHLSNLHTYHFTYFMSKWPHETKRAFIYILQSNYSRRLMVCVCLFFCTPFIFLNAYPEICCWMLPKVVNIKGGGGSSLPDATAVLLMTRHPEIWYHKCRLEIYLRTKSSAQHELIDHCILSSASGIQREITVKGQKLGTVPSFKYLGAVVLHHVSNLEFCQGLHKPLQLFQRQQPVWRDNDNVLDQKGNRSIPLSIPYILYACESETFTAEIEKERQAFWDDYCVVYTVSTKQLENDHVT